MAEGKEAADSHIFQGNKSAISLASSRPSQSPPTTNPHRKLQGGPERTPTSEKRRVFQHEKEVQESRVASALKAISADRVSSQGSQRSYERFEPTAGLKEMVSDKLKRYRQDLLEKSQERRLDKYRDP